MEIYVDADACPVKDQVVRVAERHELVVHMVSNSYMRLAEGPLIRRVIVSDGFDAADNWIAEQAGGGDIVITADIPLAARILETQGVPLGPTGKVFTEETIGMALAMRQLKQDLRESSQSQTYNRGFEPRDRSNFLQALDRLVVQATNRRNASP